MNPLEGTSQFAAVSRVLVVARACGPSGTELISVMFLKIH